MKIWENAKKIFGGARGCGRNDYLYTLIFNANIQTFIDRLSKTDLDVLMRLESKNMPKDCYECIFFQAYSDPQSCTLGAKPSFYTVPDDCLLKQYSSTEEERT